MIEITSRVKIRPDAQPEALAYALRHVGLSRKEDGCVSHDIFLNPEDPNEFFFYERWKDQAAIDLHFAQPYSQELAVKMKDWAAEPLTLRFSEIAGEREQTVG